MADRATIVVQFGSASGGEIVGEIVGHLSAEVDSREGGLNGGQVAFSPGAPVFLLAYKTDNVTITDVLVSAGTITPQPDIIVTLAEELSFEDVDTASLPKPATGGIQSVKWYGNSLGALTVQDDRMTVKAASSGVAVCSVTYQAVAKVYKLVSPPNINGETAFPILVLVKGLAA